MIEKGMRDFFYKAKIILKHIWRDTRRSCAGMRKQSQLSSNKVVKTTMHHQWWHFCLKDVSLRAEMVLVFQQQVGTMRH